MSLSEHRVRLADLDVAYAQVGDGPAVVLVHGLAESRHSWQRQQQDLPGVTSYAYDVRGHGDSSLGAANGSVAQLGTDLLDFLGAVSGRATVVGFSLGGTVTLWAAAQDNDLIEHAIVLGASSVVGRAAAEFYADRIAKAADPTSAAFREALCEDTAAACHLPDGELASLVARRLAAVGDGRGYANAARAMASLRVEPLTALLAGISIPVDVVGATQDAFCPEKAARIITGAIPHARYHEIGGAGHLMNADRPQAVTDVLRAVLGTGS